MKTTQTDLNEFLHGLSFSETAKDEFLENDEQYITQIVESIQNNDLKNKQASARHQQQTTQSGSTP